jgi:hypothetical protein
MEDQHDDVRTEFIAEVLVKDSVVRDITPCTRLKVNRHFEGICRLHLQV